MDTFDDDVRKIDRPVCGRNAWNIGSDGFVIQWDREENHTAYVWVPRGAHTLTHAVGCGLDFMSAVTAVRRGALEQEEEA